MENPFTELSERLTRIENLLIEKSYREQVTPTPSEEKEYMNIQQAADLLNMKVSSLYQLVHKRMIPHSKPGGKRLVFSEKELRSWIQSSRRQTVSEIQLEALKSLSSQ